MKIEKSNNPVAAGALVLVLVLIVGRIVWMLLGQNRPVSAASTVAATPASVPAPATVPDPGITPATEAAPLSAAATGTAATSTTRNPFSGSVIVRTATAPARPHRASLAGKAAGTEQLRLMPLPPLPVRSGGAGVATNPSLSAVSVPSSYSVQSVSARSALRVPPEPDPLQTLKLTAIVGGTVPMAVLQTAHPEPVVLHVGEELDGMRVIAINEHDMVFARGGKQWTLSLQSAADSSAAGAVSVTSVAVSEEKTDELQ